MISGGSGSEMYDTPNSDSKSYQSNRSDCTNNREKDA